MSRHPRRRAPSPICERLACGSRPHTNRRARDVTLRSTFALSRGFRTRAGSDEDAACLRVFCKYLIEPRRRRVRAHDHRASRCPARASSASRRKTSTCRFQPFDYCVRRLRKRRPYEAVATRPERHDQDPQSALLPVDLHATHLRKIDLRLLVLPADRRAALAACFLRQRRALASRSVRNVAYVTSLTPLRTSSACIRAKDAGPLQSIFRSAR